MSDVSDRLQPWDDPIVSEVRRIRETLFAESDYDLEKYVQRLRQKQADSGRQVVVRPPRHPDKGTGAAA
jgi:hypothetical protein